MRTIAKNTNCILLLKIMLDDLPSHQILNMPQQYDEKCWLQHFCRGASFSVKRFPNAQNRDGHLVTAALRLPRVRSLWRHRQKKTPSSPPLQRRRAPSRAPSAPRRAAAPSKPRPGVAPGGARARLSGLRGLPYKCVSGPRGRRANLFALCASKAIL